jgi:hypothetical protein
MVLLKEMHFDLNLMQTNGCFEPLRIKTKLDGRFILGPEYEIHRKSQEFFKSET